jgi:tetratricopeptide (TPR) repeat protein
MDERFPEAEKAFEKALQLDPANAAAKQGLKRSQEKIHEQVDRRRAQEKPALEAAKSAIKHESWPDALDALSAVLDRQPDHPEARRIQSQLRTRLTKSFEKAKMESSDWYYYQGVLAYMDRDWLKVVNAWDQVVAFNPDKVGLVSQLERAKVLLRKKEQADRLLLLQSIAWESLKKGDYASAVQNWEQLLAVDPDNEQAKLGVAEARKAWEEQKVRQQEEAVQRLSEKAMDAYVERDLKASGALWREVLALDPENTLAQDYLRRLRMDGAMSAVPSVSAPAVSSSSGLQKAKDYVEEGRYPDAIESLERMSAKAPGDAGLSRFLEETRAKQKSLAEAAYQDGLMSYSEGRIQEAIQRWQDALRVDSNFQRARQAIIKAMAEQRRQAGGKK